jgi:hypothetical protein
LYCIKAIGLDETTITTGEDSMDEQREPLYRVVGGSGTYANPHRLRSDLEHLLGRIYPTGNSTLGQIAQAREMLGRADVTEETRSRFEERIIDLEYQWHLHRTSDLVRLALQSHRPVSTAAQKREELLGQARAAREAFYAFAAQHPSIHEQRRGEVPTVEELMARHEARRPAQ